MQRWGYAGAIDDFLSDSPEQVFGKIVAQSTFADLLSQRSAWIEEVSALRTVLREWVGTPGAVYFEYTIPRLGGRADVLLVLGPVLFVIEFKVGAESFNRDAIDQVWDYALDLKNFHEASHHIAILPVLVVTAAPAAPVIAFDFDADRLARPVCTGIDGLGQVIRAALTFFEGEVIDSAAWQAGRYRPTPTIVEAARALYAGHAVQDISRNDAGGENLGVTSRRVSDIIAETRRANAKAICFVTGVPGAGKTLVGLDIANRHTDPDSELYSVYLSGNGPLVSVLHEALARDRHQRAREQGQTLRLGQARSEVKQFIQNVHHFRDDCLADAGPPVEHVALFDEAQRAWDLAQTMNFMARKKNRPGFDQSEPQFLISCLDRHADWAVVVCLVGSGQEINTGEAGISEWLEALCRSFPEWRVHLSPRLREIEYHADAALDTLAQRAHVHWEPCLHLATSVRSFRSERVAEFVNRLLAQEDAAARSSLIEVLRGFPIRLTRRLPLARQWLRQQARGNERYGMVISSRAQRLKPLAIDVRVKVDPVHWFLDGKNDVRSSFYLEDAATEFQVQGLELDWSCVVWDGDLRFRPGGWEHHSFEGSRWKRVRSDVRQRYLLNTYRVLLTRARQGMVIVVPEGAADDPTRSAEYYDPTYEWLAGLGVPTL
ncbi:MAG: DUF2075 domain-containing protein [Proteobacteria bacterium]|nr:DUF2075 domain-containing protein [Pseudomonadota bacterium]